MLLLSLSFFIFLSLSLSPFLSLLSLLFYLCRLSLSLYISLSFFFLSWLVLFSCFAILPRARMWENRQKTYSLSLPHPLKMPCVSFFLGAMFQWKIIFTVFYTNTYFFYIKIKNNTTLLRNGIEHLQNNSFFHLQHLPDCASHSPRVALCPEDELRKMHGNTRRHLFRPRKKSEKIKKWRTFGRVVNSKNPKTPR